MIRLFTRVATFASLLFLLPMSGYAQNLALYDNFSSPTLDATKWQASDRVSFTAFETLRVRTVTAGQLQLALANRGATTSSTGEAESRSGVRVGHVALVDGQPPITVLQAKVTVKSAVAGDCPDAGSATTRARARVQGFFFNDGTGSGAANDYTGDIFAAIDIERNSRFGEHRLVGHLCRCTDTPCSASQTLKSVIFDHQWSENVANTVTAHWIPASNKFEFTVTAGPTSETHPLTYSDLGLSDTLRPRLFAKDLRAISTVANCASGAKNAAIDVRFDNVRFNANAVQATQ